MSIIVYLHMSTCLREWSTSNVREAKLAHALFCAWMESVSCKFYYFILYEQKVLILIKLIVYFSMCVNANSAQRSTINLISLMLSNKQTQTHTFSRLISIPCRSSKIAPVQKLCMPNNLKSKTIEMNVNHVFGISVILISIMWGTWHYCRFLSLFLFLFSRWWQ